MKNVHKLNEYVHCDKNWAHTSLCKISGAYFLSQKGHNLLKL
jgi:hypothetical protein